ncbi:hypothetical protein AS156_29240 [Bradyrhizobium macuxiense]|uniref:Alpha/beta hydrolase n=1 Tax=Bradyrhizobium macuxiense TaxID=1755647 RepID=A0A109K4E0_9BRAD|nr:alpha/beta hydrolase [Bradyrhizobium macuxiense]KWV60466.1 hypothetical protein AS156_29240 [Bradyrhizobium macuxiense]
MEETEHEAERIILVHGTGAADIADRGSRWWQFGSLFQSHVQSRLAGFCFDKPFHWSGANLEDRRYLAGMELLARLYDLEGTRSAYHLVAHSHGGSVVWHCLVASARAGKKLKGLKSWTTIGTPFIAFRSLQTDLWLVVACLTACSLFAMSLAPASPDELLEAVKRLHRDGQTLPIAIYATLLTLLALIAVFAVLTVAQPLIAWLKDRHLAGSERRAKDWYGKLWLGLWHTLDEPINLIAGTLGTAPYIAPRFSTTSLLKFVPFLVPLYDTLFARAADEFIWSKIAQRAQGSNIVGRRVASVGRALLVMSPGWGPLPTDISARLTERSNLRAGETVDRLRALFEGAYDSQGSEVIFRTAARSVTFQELIHTSYFDDDGVRDLIASWIRRSSSPPESVEATVFPSPPDFRASETATAPKKGSGLTRLNLVFALALIATSGLLATATLSYFGARIAPATDRYQIESIADAMRRPSVTSVGADKALPGVLVRLEALGYGPRAEAFLDDIGDIIAMRNAAEEIGYALGYAGDFDRLEAVALRSRDSEGVSIQILSVKSAAVLGAVAAGRVPPDDLIAELRSQFVRKASGPSMRTVTRALIAFYTKAQNHVELLTKLVTDRGASPMPSAPMVTPSNLAIDQTDDCFFAYSIALSPDLSPAERLDIVRKVDCRIDDDTRFIATFLSSQIDAPDYETIRTLVRGKPIESISAKNALLGDRDGDDKEETVENVVRRVVTAIEIGKAFERFRSADLNDAFDAADDKVSTSFALHVMSGVAERLVRIGDDEGANELYTRLERDIPQLYAEHPAEAFKNEFFEADSIAAFRGLVAHLRTIGQRERAEWWTRQTYAILLDRKDDDNKLRPWWYATIADSARSLNLTKLASEALQLGLALKDPAPEERSVRGVVELATVAAALDGADPGQVTRSALEKATDWLNRVSQTEGLEVDLVRLVSGWSHIRELPRAREVAEHSPSKRATLAGYVAILDTAIDKIGSRKPAARLSLERIVSGWRD